MTVWVVSSGPASAPTPRVDAPAPPRGADGAGEAGTLDELVRRHLPGLIRYATVLVGDQHTAADLVQEVLLRAHQRWRRIALTDRPDLYLRRMVTNEHLSWRRRWHVRMVRPTADDALVGHAGTGGDHAEHLAQEDAMWHRLEQLPPRQRTVLVLRYYEGLADAEIATVLGTSPATVRSHAARALTTLRNTDPNLMETR
jgi:RNA polymerase sigma-70 factor (sigma-E family)